jgi:long-subunit fatty acid transport protein
MKKLLLLVALLLSGSFAFAQLSKGNVLVTGAFSISSSTEESTINNRTSDGPTLTSFSFVPNVSYFITNRFSVGLELGLNSIALEEIEVNGNTTITTKDVTTSFGIGPFVRYYVPLGQNFYFYGQGGFGITAGNIESTRTSVTTFGNSTVTNEVKTQSDLTAVNVRFRPGITYFLNNRFALDASFGLLNIEGSTVKTGNDEFKQSQFNFNLIPNSINFGLSYRFGGTSN